MGKRKHIKPLAWSRLWTKLNKLGWRFERPKGLASENRFYTPAGWKKRPNATHLVDYFDGADEVWKHLPAQVLYDEVPPTKRQAAEASEHNRPTPAGTTAATAVVSESAVEAPSAVPSAPRPAEPSSRSPATSPAKAPAKTPAKSPAKRPVKSTAKAPTKSPAAMTPRKRTPKAAPSTPVISSPQDPTRVQPPRNARRPAESVDISAGDDQMDSGDDDDYRVEEDDGESDVECTSESFASEDEATSDE
ncbi:hypothetical protein PR003_g7789 [Phytophthora rubi]|uniref:Uncharacterized protein n=1 Tax=Phytophthora rubi TaxID=129364 RepID=A0A6A3MQI5_9STRA|nr:hypothetical protein PR002_g7635 [Phytophthora rubi]KAE9039655.1 hypothetical protein PR001_g7419 [Phytophthora rubi]KAE9345731.1 hypothetical protein PR003_g7789 [Phytophthora rubi]